MPRVVVHRRHGRRPSSLTAAAQRVDAHNPATFRSSAVGSSEKPWQEQAWEFLEKVGELEYFVSWRASSASRCRLVASALDDQGAPTGSIDDDDPNAELVRRVVNDIAGGVSGQIKIVHRMAYLLTIVGECWVGMVVRDSSRETAIEGTQFVPDITRPGYQLEQWYIFGRDEIKSGSNVIELKLPDGTRHEFNPNADILFHLWDEHPKNPSMPVSPVWSNRDVLANIVQSTSVIRQANDSRLIGNGIMFVPQEMSLPSQNAPTALPTGTLDTLTPDLVQEPNSAQALQDLLFDVATVAKRDPDSQAAMLPIVAAVPGEMIKQVAWLRAGSDIPETTLKLQESDIRRLATGLHVSPERLLGMGTGNHWSSWLLDNTDVRVHIAPVVEIITSGLTQEILRQKLAEEGVDPNAYVVWYDSSALTQDPDKSDEARDGFDRGALTARSLRGHLGFDDDDGYDMSTSDGWVELALDKIAQDPANAEVFLPIIEAAARRVGLDVATALPAASNTQNPSTPPQNETPVEGPPEEPTSGESEPAPPPMTAAAMTVARMCVNRALELANKRRRTRSLTDVYRGVPIELAHTRLHPVPLSEAGDLIKGWTTGVMDEDLSRLGLNPAAFHGMVEGVASLALVTASPPVITQTMLRRT